jgi:mono/diheme cytochrome c family protein
MMPMHPAGNPDHDDDDDEEAWAGKIGNGHFWLRLEIDDGEGNVERVKLGVNLHLEDPADGYGTNCPGDPPVDPPVANQPPTADAGPDQTVTDSDDDGSENVTLDGSASTDAEGPIASWEWSESGSPIASGENPTVAFAVGAHTVTLTVTDGDGATDTDQVLITVEAAPGGVSFAADIQPYFQAGQANCVMCHSGGSGPAGVNLDSYAGVIAAEPAGRLRDQLLANHQNGPDDAGFVTTLDQWVGEGSQNN